MLRLFLFCFVFVFMRSLKPRPFVQSSFDMQAPRYSHPCFFIFFLETSLFTSIFFVFILFPLSLCMDFRVRRTFFPSEWCFSTLFFFWGARLRAGEGIRWLAAGTMPNSLYRMPLAYLSLTCVFCYSCSFLFVVCVFVFFFALIGAW